MRKRIKKDIKLVGYSTHKINDFEVKAKLHTRSLTVGGSIIKPKSNKTNKIIRCHSIADKMPERFMQIAFKANRADKQREGRRAKRR